MSKLVYKLIRKRKNGTLGPLFINRRLVVPIGEWLEAECVPTKGYAVRQGWHTTSTPEAPHLSDKGRVWVRAEIENYIEFKRPEAQGGLWYIAQRIRVLEEL